MCYGQTMLAKLCGCYIADLYALAVSLLGELSAEVIKVLQSQYMINVPKIQAQVAKEKEKEEGVGDQDDMYIID